MSPVGGEVVGPGVSTPAPAAAPSPPGSGSGGVQQLDSATIATGLVLDATSDRYIYLMASATGGNAEAILHMGPTSGTTTQFVSSSTPAAGNAAIGLYVPKGWYVQGSFGNSSFEACYYW